MDETALVGEGDGLEAGSGAAARLAAAIGAPEETVAAVKFRVGPFDAALLEVAIDPVPIMLPKPAAPNAPPLATPAPAPKSGPAPALPTNPAPPPGPPPPVGPTGPGPPKPAGFQSPPRTPSPASPKSSSAPHAMAAVASTPPGDTAIGKRGKPANGSGARESGMAIGIFRYMGMRASTFFAGNVDCTILASKAILLT